MTSGSTLASTIFKTSPMPGEKVACIWAGVEDDWVITASVSAKLGVKVRPNPAKKLKRLVPKEGIILAILINGAIAFASTGTIAPPPWLSSGFRIQNLHFSDRCLTFQHRQTLSFPPRFPF